MTRKIMGLSKRNIFKIISYHRKGLVVNDLDWIFHENMDYTDWQKYVPLGLGH